MLETVIRFHKVPGLDLGVLQLHGRVFDVELTMLGDITLTSCYFAPIRQDDFNDCEVIVEVWSNFVYSGAPKTR